MKSYKILLIFLFFVLFLTACSGETEELVPEYQNEFAETDFDGFNFVILTESLIGDKNFIYESNTVNSDIMLLRLASLEEKYNCLITPEFHGHDASLIGWVNNTMLSGGYCGEMAATVNSNMSISFAKSGFLLPFSSYSEIVNFEGMPQKYGSTNLLELSMLNSEVYKVIPVALPEIIDSTYVNCVFAINESLVSRFSVTDPREYYENKTWTWDTFEKAIDEMSFIDGEIQYKAFWATKYYFVRNGVMSNGMKFVDQTADGTLVSGLYDDSVISSVGWVQKIMTEYSDDVLVTDDDIWGPGQTALTDNDVFMAHVSTIHVTNYISKTVDNFGIMPFPCGPDVEYGTWTAEIPAVFGFSIFTNSYEPDSSAFIISQLFEPFEGLETEEDRLENSLRTLYFNRQDAEIMMSIYKYGQYFYWNFGGNDFWNNMAKSITTKTAAEIIESYSDMLETVIEEYVIPNNDYLASH